MTRQITRLESLPPGELEKTCEELAAEEYRQKGLMLVTINRDGDEPPGDDAQIGVLQRREKRRCGLHQSQLAEEMRGHEAPLRRRGVLHVALFGSVARGDEGPDSDIDLLVDFDQDSSLFDLMRMTRELEEFLGRPVGAVSAASNIAR